MRWVSGRRELSVSSSTAGKTAGGEATTAGGVKTGRDAGSSEKLEEVDVTIK